MVFYGLVTADEKHEMISNSHIGLLSPTGKPEAFPASPVECYSHGFNVIVGGDYGAYDNIRYFPELELKKRSLKNILTYISDSTNFLKMSEQRYNYSKSVHAMKSSEWKKWYELFNADIVTKAVGLPRFLRLKISIRDKFLRMIKYPIRCIIK